jgi:hypothetical protein
VDGRGSHHRARLLSSLGHSVAAVALANKLARIAWAMMTSGEFAKPIWDSGYLLRREGWTHSRARIQRQFLRAHSLRFPLRSRGRPYMDGRDKRGHDARWRRPR